MKICAHRLIFTYIPFVLELAEFGYLHNSPDRGRDQTVHLTGEEIKIQLNTASRGVHGSG